MNGALTMVSAPKGRQRPGHRATTRWRDDDLEGKDATGLRGIALVLTEKVDQSSGQRPVLVVGLPRSGTTWTANVLGASDGATLVSEPDNEKLCPRAIWGKHGLGRFPVLGTGDEARRYQKFWEWAVSGAKSDQWLRVAQRILRHASDADLEALAQGRETTTVRLSGIVAAAPHATPATGVVLAKSVHACLAVEWLATRLDVEVLVVMRHPANVLASWMELDLPDRDRDLGSLAKVQERYVKPWGLPDPGPGAVDRAVWQIGLFTCALEDAVSRHPEWHVRTHEQLCSDSEVQFRSLAAELSLTLGDVAIDLLRRSDKAGSGFAVERKASGLADSWRERLGVQEVEALKRVLSAFPLKTWDVSEL